MSLKEYEDLDKIRLEAGKKSRAHYASLDLPGTRTLGADAEAEAARKRIEEMRKERENSNQE